MSNGWITKGARQRIYQRDNLICCYCKKSVVSGISNQSQLTREEKYAVATLDHIVPQKDLAMASHDDRHFFELRRDPKNLVVVCQGCNSSKQHMSLFVWCEKTHKNYGLILKEIARRINTSI